MGSIAHKYCSRPDLRSHIVTNLGERALGMQISPDATSDPGRKIDHCRIRGVHVSGPLKV